MPPIEAALIGLVGVLLGILLNEMLRRRNRIEGYAARVFDKRLEIYEGLYERIGVAGDMATDVIENPDYSPEQRHEIVSAAIHGIATWCDSNDMYVNEELTVHCVPLLMGVENIYAMADAKEKEDRVKRYREDFRNAKKMIRKEAGIEDIERMFSGIVKPKRSSAIIDHYRIQKKKLKAKGKWD
jgi:hypothetical protein